MNALMCLKRDLKKFSIERKISFTYNLKTSISKVTKGNSTNCYFGKYIVYLSERERALINEYISTADFSITVKITQQPTVEVYQALAQILLEKFSHIDECNFVDPNINSEIDLKKLLRSHNYNSIFAFFVYKLSQLTYLYSENNPNYSYQVIYNQTTIPPVTLTSVFGKMIREKVHGKAPYHVRESGIGAMNLAKEICPVLLAIGDFENAMILFKLIDYDYKDTDYLVPIVNWCLSNNLSLIEKPLATLAKFEPLHPLIKEAALHLEKVKMMESTGFTLNDINLLSGTDFELLVIKSLKKYANFSTVECTSITGDYGADIIISTKNGTRIAIQCKRFSQKVNLKAVQEVTAALAHYHADIGIVISNNGFLNSAVNLAKSNDIELWSSEQLLRLLAGEDSFSPIFEL